MRLPWLFAALVASASLPALATCNVVNGKAYRDCSRVTVLEGTKPPLSVRSQLTDSAIVAGGTFHAGGALLLSGISNGDIVVLRGGRLTVTGVVNGTVRNEGGTVIIDGIVQHLASSGGLATVSGNVGAFTGAGPATFKKGSVLSGSPLGTSKRLPGQ